MKQSKVSNVDNYYQQLLKFSGDRGSTVRDVDIANNENELQREETSNMIVT